MLKRYQVLLTDWQEEYVKFLVEKYDLSFSEVIRILIVLEAIMITGHLHPEYKTGISMKKLAVELKKMANPNRNEAEMYKLISAGYFEARKAIEYRMSKEKQKAKKTKKT
jgi:predicted DNA-binding protein YlxM (UPF0122 family)